MKLKALVSPFIDLLFPPHCVLCGKLISSGSRVCGNCAQENPCVHGCKRIDLPKSGKTMLCRVPYRYEGNVRQSIIRFKFYGETHTADFFGEQIAQEFLQDVSSFDFISAVPISSQRRKLRGYNQSELVARAVGKRLGLPYRECLVKTADNPEQHKLAKQERQKNVSGVYKLAQKDAAAGRNVLIIDDIVTTGATLAECGEVLYQGGAAGVLCAAIAQVLL